MLATAAPPPAMIQPAPEQRHDLAQMLAQAARGLDENRTPLRSFVRDAWPIVEPVVPLIGDYFLDAICEHVEAAMDGQITRLIINAPPRSGKSLPVSIFGPAWKWTQQPSARFIGASYGQDLATKLNVDRRLLIRSDWYQSQWGSTFQLTGDQNVKSHIANDARGHMIARGTGAGITGFGGDFIVIDDPLNPELAESEAARREVRDYYDRTLYTRLDDKRKGVIILVEQRLHAKDLTAHLLEQKQEGWVHLNLPAEAPRKMVMTFPQSGREWVREEGDALRPARDDKETTAKMRATVGSRRWASQYQQAPTLEEGNLFKRANWRFWKTMPALDSFQEIVQSWDLTFKKKEDTDFVAGGIWGVKSAEWTLLDQVRARLSFSGTADAMTAMKAKWPAATRKLVEDKANGSAIEDYLKSKIGGIILVEPKGGKLVRAHAMQPYQEAGNIVLPDPELYPWVEDFISECAQFPDGDNDDQVDQMTQLVNYYGKAESRWRPV